MFDSGGGAMMSTISYEKMVAKQVLNQVQEPHMPFRWSINPYRGCMHGCSFCYARASHTFLGHGADESFERHIYVKGNAADVLERELRLRLKRHKGDPLALRKDLSYVAIGTATDPYQSIEAKEKVTRACLQVLAEYQIPVSITTRSPLILRDLDVLRTLPVHSVNISVHTMDTQIWRTLEASSPSPARRLDTVAELNRHGIPTGVFLAPILPFLTDSLTSLGEVVRSSLEAKAKFVMPSVLRLSNEVRPWFLSVLQTHYPEQVRSYERLYAKASPPPFYTEAIKGRVQTLLTRMGMRAEAATFYSTDRGLAPTDLQALDPVLREYSQQLSLQV
jgi:DNA repair photolyase